MQAGLNKLVVVQGAGGRYLLAAKQSKSDRPAMLTEQA